MTNETAAERPCSRTASRSVREAIARRFKDAEDPLKLVIVRDMWLTGFDVPSLHTMYVDKPMREAHKRGEQTGLNDEELAFYDALEVNDSAVNVQGDEVLKTIAHDLVEAVRRNVTIDWTVKQSVRAKIRTIVKRIY